MAKTLRPKGKYSLLKHDVEYIDGVPTYRVVSNYDFVTSTGKQVSVGDYGGRISGLRNLDNRLPEQSKAWLDLDSTCVGSGRIKDDAYVENSHVYEHGVISDEAVLTDSELSGFAKMKGQSKAVNGSHVTGTAELIDSCEVDGEYVDSDVYSTYYGATNSKNGILLRDIAEQKGENAFEAASEDIMEGQFVEMESEQLFRPGFRRLPDLSDMSDTGYSALDLEEYQ